MQLRINDPGELIQPVGESLFEYLQYWLMDTTKLAKLWRPDVVGSYRHNSVSAFSSSVVVEHVEVPRRSIKVVQDSPSVVTEPTNTQDR